MKHMIANPAIAATYANIFGTTALSQLSQGFSADTELALYKALSAYPDAMRPLAIIKTMTKPHPDLNALRELVGENAEQLDRERIQTVKDVGFTDVVNAVEGNLNAWDDLPALAQWNIHCRVEDALNRSRDRYLSWYVSNPSAANKSRFDRFNEGVEAIKKITDTLYEELKDDLQEAVAEGKTVRGAAFEEAA